MLSFFELLIFTTTISTSNWLISVLWFAFFLWTTDIYNNNNIFIVFYCSVVICFLSLNYWYLQQLICYEQTKYPVVIWFLSLNYWYLQQHGITGVELMECCDLLSFFELLIFTTTLRTVLIFNSPLWFAFFLWTTDIYNNFASIVNQ